jgi:hypothetical protein
MLRTLLRRKCSGPMSAVTVTIPTWSFCDISQDLQVPGVGHDCFLPEFVNDLALRYSMLHSWHSNAIKMVHKEIKPLSFSFWEVKLSLCFTTQAWRSQGVWGSGCIDPRFLGLSNSWRWVVSFTHLPLYPRGKSPPGIRWIGSWVGPGADLDDMEKWKFLTPPGLEHRPLSRPARSQSLYRPNIDWGCLITGCRGGYLDRRGMRWRNSGETA